MVAQGTQFITQMASLSVFSYVDLVPLRDAKSGGADPCQPLPSYRMGFHWVGRIFSRSTSLRFSRSFPFSPPPKPIKDSDLQELMEDLLRLQNVFFLLESNLSEIRSSGHMKSFGLGVVRDGVRGTFKDCFFEKKIFDTQQVNFYSICLKACLPTSLVKFLLFSSPFHPVPFRFSLSFSSKPWRHDHWAPRLIFS